MTVGDNSACALLTSGGIECWGGNTYGQVGNTTTTAQSTPTSIFSSGTTAVSVGVDFACSVLTGGGLDCWGYNSTGQLGDGTANTQLSPENIFSP